MFKIYSSSAGSGKTYTLTKEYLKLALHTDSETYFRSILAVTFTNAAANEMKDRILTTLRIFSEMPAGSSEIPAMMKDIVTELFEGAESDQEIFNAACELISGRAKVVFRQILHRYSDFSVMTIDKFTQRLISSFTDELGIPFIFETQLDSDLLDDAVDRVLARIGQEGEEILTEIVEKYYRENAEEGKSWGTLPAQIRQTSGTLLSEQSYVQMKRVEDLGMQDWVSIRKQMRDFVREKERSIARLAGNAFQRIQATVLAEKDFHQGGRGIYGYFRDRAEDKKLWAEPNSYAYKTIGEGVWYGAKTPTLIRDEIENIRTDLENYFHQIENIRLSESKKITLYNQLDRHMYNLSLLGEIRKEFDALLKQNNQVHISDFNRKISEVVSREPVPFIFERLGERYNHILVDEFQDTSKLQFANLLPLLENALASGFFNLIVGDAKQSIYRFRGGDMDLILHLSQEHVMRLGPILGENEYHNERLQGIGYYLQVNQLRVNRRSYREITEFNNRFFSFIASETSPDFPMVSDVYDQYFEQEIPDGVSEGGHVEIEFLEMQAGQEDAEEDGTADNMVIRTLELIGELRSKNYNWRDIAVLCRKKKEATAIANALKQSGIPLISDDALSLGYSRSVHFVISFMKVLHSPDNRLARYEAAYLYHHVVRRENPSADEFEQIRILCESTGLDTFLEYFRRWNIGLTSFRLRQLSVFELGELLMQKFGMFGSNFENEYLFRFLDVILEFGTRKTNHLGDFLVYWENARSKLSITIPEETDAIRITTIHKSKGLEYPVVIVPYAHWKTTPNARLDRLWVDLDALDYEELQLQNASGLDRKLRSSMVSVVKELENTDLADQYRDEQTRTLVENLNLLYVAFTRPVQRLYILAKRERRWEGTGQVSHWLKNFLSQDHVIPVWEDHVSQYVISQGTGIPRHAHLKNNSAPYLLKSILSNDRTESLRLRRMADRIFDVQTFEKRHDRLQKIRYLMSRLRSHSDLLPALDKLVDEGIFTRKETGQIAEQVEGLLLDPSLNQLYEDSNNIQNNKEMLLPGGKMLHIDRVVQRVNGDTVFMSFVGGDNAAEHRRHLKKLIRIFRDMGKVASGVLITIQDELIEWVTD